MERAVVTFIDILGFKNLVDSKSEHDMREILSLFQRFNKETPFSKFIPKDSIFSKELSETIKTIFFSDSVVRIRYAPNYKKAIRVMGLICAFWTKS